jgi:hypothetical protein
MNRTPYDHSQQRLLAQLPAPQRRVPFSAAVAQYVKYPEKRPEKHPDRNLYKRPYRRPGRRPWLAYREMDRSAEPTESAPGSTTY